MLIPARRARSRDATHRDRPVPEIAMVVASFAVAVALAACSPSDAQPRETPAPTDAQTSSASPAAPPSEAPHSLPSGVITYSVEGDLTSVRAATPEDALPQPVVAERQRPAYAPEDGREVYPSPDGEAQVRVRRADSGVFLEAYVADVQVVSTMIAGPDDPDAVAGSKVAARAVEGVPLTVAWSPDNRYIAFGSLWGDPFFLGVIHVGSWSISHLPVQGGYVGELAWSPSGDLLAIPTYELDRRDHTVLLFEPVSFTVERLVDGCVVTWSPDGDFVAIHREPAVESGVWIASVRDDLLVPVTREEAAYPVAWTADDAVSRP